VKLGATTMWERWDGWVPERGFQDPGMNSFNHYAFGSVGEFLYRTIGGIDTDGPGFKKIFIRPHVAEGLTFAKAKYESINGTIESSWRIEGDQVKLDVTIPVNTTATVYVGAEKHLVESGRYSFTAPK
jgi:alpha-L-rhamnosidase